MPSSGTTDHDPPLQNAAGSSVIWYLLYAANAAYLLVFPPIVVPVSFANSTEA